jgi:hypothetical protein
MHPRIGDFSASVKQVRSEPHAGRAAELSPTEYKKKLQALVKAFRRFTRAR